LIESGKRPNYLATLMWNTPVLVAVLVLVRSMPSGYLRATLLHFGSLLRNEESNQAHLPAAG